MGRCRTSTQNAYDRHRQPLSSLARSENLLQQATGMRWWLVVFQPTTLCDILQSGNSAANKTRAHIEHRTDNSSRIWFAALPQQLLGHPYIAVLDTAERLSQSCTPAAVAKIRLSRSASCSAGSDSSSRSHRSVRHKAPAAKNNAFS